MVVDSREAGSGSLFVAFAGEQADGHDFVQNAFDRGATAALVQQTVPGGHTTIDLRDSSSITPESEIDTPVCTD